MTKKLTWGIIVLLGWFFFVFSLGNFNGLKNDCTQNVSIPLTTAGCYHRYTALTRFFFASKKLSFWTSTSHLRDLPKGQENLALEVAIVMSLSNFEYPSWKLDNQCYHRYTVITRFFFVSKNEMGYHSDFCHSKYWIAPIPNGQENLPPEAAIFASVSNFEYLSWKLDSQCYHRYTVLTRFSFVSKNETGCRKGQVNVTQFSLPRDKTGRVQTDKYIRLL